MSFHNIKYLNSGAENAAFKMSDGKILRIRKDCQELAESEQKILQLIVDTMPLYFVKIYSVGSCKDLKNRELSIATSFCNNNSENLCKYSYVILDEAKDTNFIVFFLKYFINLIIDSKFDEIINNEQNISNIKQFSNNTIKYILKIIDGLIDANYKLNNFRHNDFNYRNCHIDSSFNPTIFDFGASLNNIRIDECGDIITYIQQILTDIEVESSIYISVISNWNEINQPERNKIIKNFRVIREKFRDNAIFNYIIDNYFVKSTRQENDKGIYTIIRRDGKRLPQSLHSFKHSIISFLIVK